MRKRAPKIADGPPERADGMLVDLARDPDTAAIHDLVPHGPPLVLAPHSEDEMPGRGQTIAAAIPAGHGVTVVQISDGGTSHLNSRSHLRDRLAALRTTEFAAAIDILGAGWIEARALALPDDALLGDICLEGRALVALTALRAERRFGTIWTAWEGDPHTDRQAVARYARQLCGIARRHTGRVPMLWFYAAWGRFADWGAGVPSSALRVFDHPRLRATKRVAMACYASQLTALIGNDPMGFVMPTALSAHLADFPQIFVGRAR